MKCSVLIAIAFLVSGLAYGQTADEYFNRAFDKANLEDDRGAIDDYSKAIELNPNDTMAYYNRGISKLILGQKDEGCVDLSKAGELGYYEAYDMIKKFCN
jgi:tetratricopeptide (TPR) repeat protein